MNILVGALLAGLALLAMSLQRTYGAIQLKELKRRAREGDDTAVLLHRVAGYGISLRAVLWLLIGIAAAGFFVYISRHTSYLAALGLSSLLVWIGFVWLPNREVKRISVWFAGTLARPLAWLLQYVHTPLVWLHEFIARHKPVTIHTGLYDKDDLLQLIQAQTVQPDNRIEQYELELALQALTFGDKLVGDYLTPRRITKTVSIDDSIGPLLMSELHGSGFSRFPVYEGKKNNFVGTLFLRDLVKTKTSAKVKDVMRKEIAFVHEDQTLYDALQAILKTRNHLLVVVNSFEEYVGVITIEDVLEQIIGRSIRDEFDQYDDLRAVAQRAADKEHSVHQDQAASASEEPTEVIE